MTCLMLLIKTLAVSFCFDQRRGQLLTTASVPAGDDSGDEDEDGDGEDRREDREEEDGDMHADSPVSCSRDVLLTQTLTPTSIGR